MQALSDSYSLSIGQLSEKVNEIGATGFVRMDTTNELPSGADIAYFAHSTGSARDRLFVCIRSTVEKIPPA